MSKEINKLFRKLEVVSIGNKRHLILEENLNIVLGFNKDTMWWSKDGNMIVNKYMIYIEKYTLTRKHVYKMREVSDVLTAYIIFNKIRKEYEKV